MRAIKFRAWHKEGRRMLHSKEMEMTYTSSGGDGEYFLPVGFNLDGLRSKKVIEYDTDEGDLVESRLVLMQYTGLKDKADVEIYEGDLLKWVDWHEELTDKPDIYRVDWLGREARFSLNCFRDGRQLDPKEDMLRLDDEFEVIGNIFENPELLEVTS